MTSRALLVESLTALEDLLVSAHYNRADDTMEMPAERYRQANGALTVLKQALADAARLDREEQAVFHMTAQQKTTLQRLLASFTADDPEALDSWFQRRGVTREAVLEALTAVVVTPRVMTKHGPFPNCSSCGLPIDSGGFCSSKCAGGDAEMVSCTCSECASRVPETPPPDLREQTLGTHIPLDAEHDDEWPDWQPDNHVSLPALYVRCVCQAGRTTPGPCEKCNGAGYVKEPVVDKCHVCGRLDPTDDCCDDPEDMIRNLQALVQRLREAAEQNLRACDQYEDRLEALIKRAEKAESRVKDLEGEVARRLNDNIQHRERERALGDRVAKLEGELATTTSTLRDVFRVCLQLGKDYYDGLVND